MKLEIITGDITKIKCDAIVCPVGQRLNYSKGISTTIYEAAGKSSLKMCSLNVAIGRCFVTGGYNLASANIIHTVFPYINPHYDSYKSIFSKLPQCYQNAVQRALTEGYSSLAFPLLGAWDDDVPVDFPMENVLDIALSSLDTMMKEDKRELNMYLVLTNEQQMLLQKALAKRKYANAAQNKIKHEDFPVDKRWISLCKVNRPDRNRDVWLLRLADASEGSLTAPAFDDTKDQIFDNRRLIFREDGPIAADHLGFWEWKERKSDSGRWWSNATYIEETKPIEIFVINKHTSAEQVAETLKAGLSIPSYLNGSILFAAKTDGAYTGLLCELSDFDIRPGLCPFISLKDSVHTLPYYEWNESDIFTWNDRKVYKHITLGEAKQRIPVRIPVQMLKQLFLQRMTWPVFKAQGIQRGDWQKIKQFFSEIPDSTILESVSQTYGMSVQEVRSCVDAFLNTIEAHINVEDVDSSLIVQMLDHHEGLRKELFDAAEKKWREEHQEEVEQARLDIANMRSAAEQEVQKAKQHLADIEKTVTEKEAKHQGILTEIAAAQAKLDQLVTDIEQYEALGSDTMDAVRRKIADAQKDMAGFLADISVFLPQQQTAVASAPEASSWKYISALNDAYGDKEADESETYHDEVDAISQNLTNCLRVDPAFSNMLSAFLYAAHINNAPVLIAGPGGCDLAEIMSVSLHGSGAGQLLLEDGYDCDVVTKVAEHAEGIIAVQNMFGKGWNDGYPQMFTGLDKQVIWTHPYAEDLAIEPKGLYNYMLPLFSECFVGAMAGDEPWPGKRAAKFKQYVSKKQNPLRIAAFKRLGLSRLLLNRLTQVLSDAKAILNNPAGERDMEVLFGLLPLCVLIGRTDILKETIESENGLSAAVKAEARRYIEEV